MRNGGHVTAHRTKAGEEQLGRELINAHIVRRSESALGEPGSRPRWGSVPLCDQNQTLRFLHACLTQCSQNPRAVRRLDKEGEKLGETCSAGKDSLHLCGCPSCLGSLAERN
jgi:hypothetical protein